MPHTSAPFVRKTLDLVNKAEDSIVRWSDDGTSFIIVQPHVFQQNVLPLYFKHNNLCSFVRQLNTYGFRKVVRPVSNANELEECLEFRHEFFLRHSPHLVEKIKRRKAKNSLKRSREEANSSPLTSPTPTEFEEELQSLLSDSGVVDTADDVNQFLMNHECMAEAITNITERQRETQLRIQVILTELKEAKRLIEELESRNDTCKDEPVWKKVKTEPSPQALAAIDDLRPPTPEKFGDQLFEPFDIREFLLQGTPCL